MKNNAGKNGRAKGKFSGKRKRLKRCERQNAGILEEMNDRISRRRLPPNSWSYEKAGEKTTTSTV